MAFLSNICLIQNGWAQIYKNIPYYDSAYTKHRVSITNLRFKLNVLILTTVNKHSGLYNDVVCLYCWRGHHTCLGDMMSIRCIPRGGILTMRDKIIHRIISLPYDWSWKSASSNHSQRGRGQKCDLQKVILWTTLCPCLLFTKSFDIQKGPTFGERNVHKGKSLVLWT